MRQAGAKGLGSASGNSIWRLYQRSFRSSDLIPRRRLPRKWTRQIPFLSAYPVTTFAKVVTQCNGQWWYADPVIFIILDDFSQNLSSSSPITRRSVTSPRTRMRNKSPLKWNCLKEETHKQQGTGWTRSTLMKKLRPASTTRIGCFAFTVKKSIIP